MRPHNPISNHYTTCRVCGEWRERYHPKLHGRICRPCKLQERADYIHPNPDKKRERDRKHQAKLRAANPEKFRAANRQWAKNNRAKLLESERKRRNENPDYYRKKTRDQQRRYRAIPVNSVTQAIRAAVNNAFSGKRNG